MLVPINDGTGCADGARQANLRQSLAALKPMLEEAGIIGLVEPLGFEICSLRSKTEAADAIEELGAQSTFRLVHDTFHHHLAGEAAIFPELTGLVHISGVSDPAVSVADMRDPASRPGRCQRPARQCRADPGAAIRRAMTAPSPSSPLRAEVHALKDPAEASASMEYLTARV